MPDIDRVKVIKGLEDAYRVIEDYVPSRYRGYSRLACCDAIDLLREQEPVKPAKVQIGNRTDYFCRNCTTRVGMLFSNEDAWRFHYHFCPRCGREVKWDA